MDDFDTKKNKNIAFIGLGRMGIAMVERLLEYGYQVHVTDVDASAREKAGRLGATVYQDSVGLVSGMPEMSLVWIMVPAQFVDEVIKSVQDKLPMSSTIVDGGNSDYRESKRRHQELRAKSIHFLDCGTSGGVEGARQGASLMVGGEKEVFTAHEDVFKTLATKDGYALVGDAGAGHFVKAVHNAIEYGMMGALAEGFALLESSKEEFGIKVDEVVKPYANGSIISSRLLDWLISGYKEGMLDEVTGVVPVGETENKMKHLTELGNMFVLDASIEQRISTRKEPARVGKYISIMRYKFGGHKPNRPNNK